MSVQTVTYLTYRVFHCILDILSHSLFYLFLYFTTPTVIFLAISLFPKIFQVMSKYGLFLVITLPQSHSTRHQTDTLQCSVLQGVEADNFLSHVYNDWL